VSAEAGNKGQARQRGDAAVVVYKLSLIDEAWMRPDELCWMGAAAAAAAGAGGTARSSTDLRRPRRHLALLTTQHALDANPLTRDACPTSIRTSPSSASYGGCKRDTARIGC